MLLTDHKREGNSHLFCALCRTQTYCLQGMMIFFSVAESEFPQTCFMGEYLQMGSQPNWDMR